MEPKNSCNHVPGFQAELRVAKQEPDGPRVGLTKELRRDSAGSLAEAGARLN